MITDPLGPDELTRTVCLQLLGGAGLGRVVYTVGAMPAVEPVNYVVDGEAIVIRTDTTSKLAAGGRRDIVAFQVDEIDSAEGTGWSVVVTGRASEVRASADRVRLAALPLLARLSLPAGKPGGVHARYVRISCDIVAGRRLDG